MRFPLAWLRKLIALVIPQRPPARIEIDLPQVETPEGFVPVRDLPFNARNLAHASTRRVVGQRQALARQAAGKADREQAVGAREDILRMREHLLPGTDQSERTFCPACLGNGQESQSFVGPVFSTIHPADIFTDGQGNYHRHDPNEQTLTYLCSKGHRWERTRYQRCWCRWTAEPEKEKL